jgi:hypothetical protein
VNDIVRTLLVAKRDDLASNLDMALNDRKGIRFRLEQINAEIDRMVETINAISEALGEPKRDVPA